MRFGKIARKQQAAFRHTLSPASQVPADDKGNRHGHLLALGHELENLMPELRGPDGALEFFRERKIPWWRNARSGDSPGTGPTRNLASSQVCCVNFLMPLASRKGALEALVRAMDPDVLEVVPIEYDRLVSSVEFE